MTKPPSFQGEVSVTEDYVTSKTVNVKSFKWLVTDFLVKIQSPAFKRCTYCEFKMLDTEGKNTPWVLALKWKRGDMIFFGLCCNNPSPIWGSYEVSLLDSNNKKQFTKKDEGREFVDEKLKLNSLEDFLNIDNLKNNENTFLPGGTLTVNLVLKIESKAKPKSGSNCLTADLIEAFTEMNNSDCMINCNDEKFNCHTFMLSARSPVFKAMLSNGFQESVTKTVRIDSFTPSTIKDMLKFIYTDKVENLESNACDLFKAADHYQIDLLKELMEELLTSKLNCDNALDSLVLADTYNAITLKNASLSYIVENVKVLISTPEWKVKAVENPELFVEVTQSLVNNIHQSSS